MKIVYINTLGTLGGAEMCLLDVMAAVRRARPDWRLALVLGEDGRLRSEAEALGVRCAVLPVPESVARVGDAVLKTPAARLGLAARGPAAMVAAGGYVGRLRRLLRSEAPDLVQTNGMKAHVLGAWSAPRGVPVVWHLHDYVGSRPVMSRLLQASASAGRRAVVGVAVSRSVAEDAARALGDRVAVRTITNAVDLDRFAPGPGDGAALDRAAGLPPPADPETVRVGLVATFARWKGHEVFLEATARVRTLTDRPARFYIVGGPIYRSLGSQYTLEELRDRIDRLGLADRVGLTGHQDDPASAMRALDVVVHASTRPEPFGRVIVEAMACGRPVVAANVGGAAELFDDGTEALGCPPGNPQALAEAIARLVNDPELRHHLADHGRRAAEHRFDARRLDQPWINLYQATRSNEQ